jgi:hypothetical protein
MNTQPTHIDNLNKVMGETFFIYKNVTVEKLVGGFRVLSQKVKSMEEVDEVIKKGYGVIEKSIR